MKWYQTDLFSATIEALLLAFTVTLSDENISKLKFLVIFVVIWTIVIVFTYFRSKRK